MPKYCSQIGCQNSAISQAQAEETEKLFGEFLRNPRKFGIIIPNEVE